jgi:cobalt-zinc-cadmium resistance protein CzcA
VSQVEQSIAVDIAQKKGIESQGKADFSLGYAIQHYNDGGWLHGLQAGIALPLFRQNIRKQLAAQDVKILSMESQAEATRIMVQNKLSDVSRQLSIFDKGIAFYDEQLADLMPEMERISQLNYQAGELSYLELLNVLNLHSQQEQGYLEQVYLYNQASAIYEYLTNQRF